MKKILFLILLGLTISCSENNSNSEKIVTEEITEIEISDQEYIEKGKKIAKASFVAMKGKLMSAMKDGGVENAVNFCNVNAKGLVDSLSMHYNVEIKRTSLKLRNENNSPTEEEQEMLMQYAKDFESKTKVKPIIKRGEESVSFYAPIPLKGACTSCHGEVDVDIKTEDYSKIKALYSNDKATGYKVNDFRGIWHITFDK